MKILIVEDAADLREAMCAYLLLQQYRCETATTFAEARQKTDDNLYDCIVLDLGLPGGDGLRLLELIKKEGKTEGVIIISARAQLEDKLRGLQLGADDYLTKPFHMPELSARIAAIIRRKYLRGNATIHFEEIVVDTVSRDVSVCGESVVLTPKEYELLLYFLVNKNRVISKTSIVNHLWGDEMDMPEDYNFLYGQIKNLRRKLIAAGAQDYLRSVYGTGYKFSLQ